MKKILLGVMIISSFLVVGCSSSENNDMDSVENVLNEVSKEDGIRIIKSYNKDLKLEMQDMYDALSEWMNGESETSDIEDKFLEMQDYSNEKIKEIENISSEISNNGEDLTEKEGNIIKYTKRNFEDTIEYISLVLEGISSNDNSKIEKATEIVKDIKFSIIAMESLEY